MNNEIIGTIASLFVVCAFVLKGEKNIRIVDSAGAFLFVIYGFLIHSFSNIFLNTILLCVNVYNLIKLSHANK